MFLQLKKKILLENIEISFKISLENFRIKFKKRRWLQWPAAFSSSN